MMYLIMWEGNDSLFPKDPEERKKLIMSFMEQTKKSVDDGMLKMYGISVGGGHGFAISEQDPKEIYAATSAYFPYIRFKIKPMLSIDEAIDVMKAM